jgi:hypothetical protein
MLKKNSPAILVSIVLIFVARAIELQGVDIDFLSCTLLVVVFAAIAYVLDQGAKKLLKSKDPTDLSTDWMPYLLFGFIISLAILILDSLLSISPLSTWSLVSFLSPIWAAIAYSLLATIVTLIKANKLDHRRLSHPASYLICAAVLNSVMLYVFLFVLK